MWAKEVRLSAIHTSHVQWRHRYAAAAAKSLQWCPALCDPTDSSPPGSPIPGILQARTLEWVAISFKMTVIDTPVQKTMAGIKHVEISAHYESYVSTFFHSMIRAQSCFLWVFFCSYWFNPLSHFFSHDKWPMIVTWISILAWFMQKKVWKFIIFAFFFTISVHFNWIWWCLF